MFCGCVDAVDAVDVVNVGDVVVGLSKILWCTVFGLALNIQSVPLGAGMWHVKSLALSTWRLSIVSLRCVCQLMRFLQGKTTTGIF